MEEDVIDRRSDNWEYVIGNHTVLFNTKEDAIFYMLDDIDTLISGKLTNNTTLIGFGNFDDVYYNLLSMNFDDFYKTIDLIKEFYNISDSIKLINLDYSDKDFS